MSTSTVAQRAPHASERIVYWLSAHWLLVFNAAWGVFVIVPWLAPVFMKLGFDGLGHGIYFVYQLVCHQLPERSFFLFGPQPMYSLAQIGAVWPVTDPAVLRQFVGNADFGWKVAYSDRMVSMYTGIWFTSLAFGALRRRWRPLPLWGYALLLLPMLIDGGTHFLSDVLAGPNWGTGFRDTNAWLAQLTGYALPTGFYVGSALGSFNSIMRLLTGALFGAATVWFAWPYLDATFGEIKEELTLRIARLRKA